MNSKGPFRCTRVGCPKVYKSEKLFTAHIQKHLDTQCQACDTDFPDLKSFDNHLCIKNEDAEVTDDAEESTNETAKSPTKYKSVKFFKSDRIYVLSFLNKISFEF